MRLRVLDLTLPGLPAELDGLRIVHLSDFHLGRPSSGTRAIERAAEWTAERRPDLVAITGDLLTHPRGESGLRRVIERLQMPTVAVLGNHDLALSRDPQVRPSNLQELEPAVLLRDEGRMLELRGRRIWLAGVQPWLITHGLRRIDPNSLVPPPEAGGADLRILLSHYPRVLEELEPGAFDLVLAGHMHDGQICLPYPGGKVRLAHPRARYDVGVYRSRASTLHVSPGLGTTFVPFRFAARPEATELVLRARAGVSDGPVRPLRGVRPHPRCSQ